MEICTFWLGSELRFIDKVCLASMVKSGSKVALYSYGPVKGVPPAVDIRDAEPVLPYSKLARVNPDFPHINDHIARLQFSDLFRIALMRHGKGFWLDTDVYMINPFVPDPGKFYLAHEGGGRLGVSAMYFPTHHAIVQEFCAWVESDATLPPWLGIRRGFLRPLLYRMTGRSLTTLKAGITIFGNDGITRLARRHGIFHDAAPKTDFYALVGRDIEQIYLPGSRDALLKVAGIKGLHIHRKEGSKRAPVAGSFFDWAVSNVADYL